MKRKSVVSSVVSVAIGLFSVVPAALAEDNSPSAISKEANSAPLASIESKASDSLQIAAESSGMKWPERTKIPSDYNQKFTNPYDYNGNFNLKKDKKVWFTASFDDNYNVEAGFFYTGGSERFVLTSGEMGGFGVSFTPNEDMNGYFFIKNLSSGDMVIVSAQFYD
ncbi:hypothetical protein [Brevibacillus brevis]|uniref:hypothetical protein n=1 Tax=Brevibacillus brevis TaxID=1393 RepID=UPI0025A54340|nr:hypothetical protein [Brevibacillus brevis]WJQ83764.1 hypothetical protein QN310_11785 [Brevibacillus brevis]